MGGAAFTIGEDSYAASDYTTINANGTTITGPFSVNLYATGVGNRPAAFGQLNYPGFAFAFEALSNGQDRQGVRMMIVADSLVVSTFDILHADTLLQSEYFAAIPGLSGLALTDAGNAGALRGTYSKNVVKNYVQKKVVNIFLPRGAWLLAQSGRGLHHQARTPMELAQEVPLAGQSFDYDETRYRSRRRMNVGWIDSRFWFMGNDGSATLRH